MTVPFDGDECKPSQSPERQRFDRINKHWRVRLDSPINPYTIETRHERGGRGNPYYLDLERAGSGAAICDWIFQIRSLWFCNDPEVVSTLLEAIRIVLDPQGNFCSWGASGDLGKTICDRSELQVLIEKNWRKFRKNAGLPEVDAEENEALYPPKEDAVLREDLPAGYSVVEIPAIDRTAPICTVCGEVINDPERCGAISLEADSDVWPEDVPRCVLTNGRYHVHHRRESCAPTTFVRWSPLFSEWFDDFVDKAALYVTRAA